MSPDSPITVRLCVDDAALRRRVGACLTAGQANVRVVDATQEADIDVAHIEAADIDVADIDVADIDVIVADGVAQCDADAAVGRILLGEGESLPPGGGDSLRPGVDAVLPVDFLDRELVLVCRLVAEMARLRRQLASGDTARRVLRSQMLTDAVTTLANRRGWDEALGHALGVCRQRGEPVCVAVVDLDRFKRINDALGHAAGDDVLRRAGDRLAAALRKDDVVARLGGDEFAVLLPGLGREDARAVVERIRRRVSEVDVSDLAAGTGDALTASAGYVSVTAAQLEDSKDTTLGKTILDAADRAMYEAKGAGRDCTRGGETAP